MLSNMCGRNLFSTSCVEMRFIEDACQKKNCQVSYTIIMLPYDGHFGTEKTIAKVVQGPTMFKDAKGFVITCDRCQWTRNISKRHEMPQSGILKVELFEVWGDRLHASLSSFP